MVALWSMATVNWLPPLVARQLPVALLVSCRLVLPMALIAATASSPRLTLVQAALLEVDLALLVSVLMKAWVLLVRR